MKQIPVSLLTLTAGIVITLISFWVGQNHGLLPEQASIQAPMVDRFFNVMMTIATALFLVVEGTILIFVIKYRQPKGDTSDGIPVEGNLPLEAFWTAIPAIIVIGLGIYSVDVFQQMGGFHPGGHHHGAMVAQASETTHVSPKIPEYGIGASSEESQPATLVVNVTAMQYAWLFNYPDSGLATGELHVPVGQDVQLNLFAQDVIHAFWVPQFRLKQDVIPGEETELRFVATKPGSYPIVCTELCGSYHGGMRSQIIVHTPEEFDQWLEESRIAQGLGTETVAVNPADLSPSDFLAPYAAEMGISEMAIAHLHH